MEASLRSHLLLCSFPLTTAVYQILNHDVTKSPKLETYRAPARQGALTWLLKKHTTTASKTSSDLGAKSACAMLILG